MDWIAFFDGLSKAAYTFGPMVPPQYQPVVRIVQLVLPVAGQLVQDFDKLKAASPDLFAHVNQVVEQLKQGLPVPPNARH